MSPANKQFARRRASEDLPSARPLKHQRVSPGVQLDINADCPKTAMGCEAKWSGLRDCHAEKSSSKYEYQFLPFSYVHHLLYPYPALLPVAMARPDYLSLKNEVAFKLFFCPYGVGNTIEESVTFTPSLRKLAFSTMS
jgi:hypothetical protein